MNDTNDVMGKITSAVEDFFGSEEYVWVIPGTVNHAADFYGRGNKIKLKREEVIARMQAAMTDWQAPEWIKDKIGWVIEQVLDDLQCDEPAESSDSEELLKE